MSTPDNRKDPVGAKYQGMSREEANEAAKRDEHSRDGGIQDRITATPETPRMFNGLDTWKQWLWIEKLERVEGELHSLNNSDGKPEYFGSMIDKTGPVLDKAMDSIRYWKARDPNFEYRLYRGSFKHGIQRLV